jgi:hypothetical protein
VENLQKPPNSSVQRRRRDIFVERHPPNDKATSGAADWEDVAPDGA